MTVTSLSSVDRENSAVPLPPETTKDFDRCRPRETAADFENNDDDDPVSIDGDSNTTTDDDEGGRSLHRRRTLYLIRHGEAEHNVLEAIAQKKAKEEAEELGLTPEETLQRMEEARKSVLNDPSLHDATLTDKGRQQAREASRKLNELIDSSKLHHPTEAMCSPLSRCLETCKILLENSTDLKAHIRHEISERRTLYPPDTSKPIEELLRYTQDDDRFLTANLERSAAPEGLGPPKRDGAVVSESKEMLRERAREMFHLLMECEHRHVLVVSHKGFLRELERGLLEIPDSPLFGNCELRVYRVIFTMGDRELYHQERIV